MIKVVLLLSKYRSCQALFRLRLCHSVRPKIILRVEFMKADLEKD